MEIMTDPTFDHIIALVDDATVLILDAETSKEITVEEVQLRLEYFMAVSQLLRVYVDMRAGVSRVSKWTRK